MKRELTQKSSDKIWTSSASQYKDRKYLGKYDTFRGDRVFNLWQIEPARIDQKPVSYNSWQAAKKDGWGHDQE